MTTKVLKKEFELTINRVCEVLTDENVEDLAFVCEENPERRALITTPKQLFDALSSYDILRDDNVDVLIEWVDELNLTKASSILKAYRRTHVTGE